jgi:alpha-1,6-mannosyltransferase
VKARNGHRASSGRTAVTNAALLILGTALFGLTRQLTIEFHHFSIGFSAVASWSLLVYALAALVVLTQPVNRYSLVIVVAFAIAFRAVTLTPEPFLSSDIYRYAWDGVVQHAHISPYRYVPGDPALTFLRAPHRDLFDHINRRDYAHTIYPPVAQFLFYLITSLNTSVTFMKLAMILFEGVTVYALLRLLVMLGRKREEVLLYAWCPLLLWEIGSSGHLDSAAIALISLALLARARRMPIATGLCLGAAILIKFYPVVLFPALWQRRDFKMPLTIAAMAAISYACYASVGRLVFGFLGGYVDEEGLQSGARYFLLQLTQRVPGLHQMPVAAYLACVAVVLGAIALWSWAIANRNEDSKGTASAIFTFRLPTDYRFLAGAMWLAFLMMLFFAPHYPWYVVWLVPFAVLLSNVTLFAYTLGLFYLCTTPLGSGTVEAQYHLNCVLYAGTAVVALLEATVRVWMTRRALRGCAI